MRKNIFFKFIITLFVLLFAILVQAQETNLLFKQADNFERGFKEQDALNIYRQIVVIDPSSIKALVKTTELSCSTGERQLNKNDKRLVFESALAFAQRAVKADSSSADAYYAIALASSKMAEVETDNKKVVGFIRDTRFNADKALKLNPNHAMANFIEGKWQYEMITLNWAKRFAAKIVYGGLPDADIEQAIQYLEKSLSLDPYFMLTSVVLAKAYKVYNRPAKEIEVLSHVVKLPIRTLDDTALKAEAHKRLQELE
jgi:tetratricopeptide (TPR) repeat protein